MTFKDIVKQSWNDLKSLELNFKNICVLIVVTFMLSNIVTPLIGVPVGLLGSAYYLQRKDKNDAQ